MAFLNNPLTFCIFSVHLIDYSPVKYRENSNVKTDNPLYNIADKNDRIFIVTKNATDYGIMKLENGLSLVRIPVYTFLYLIGMEESSKLLWISPRGLEFNFAEVHRNTMK